MKKAVLFDIDGVLVRNQTISTAVEKRAVSYVRTHAKLCKNVHAKMVNLKLYKSYGHTHTGMKFVYGIKDSIHDYNAHVYDKKTMKLLFRELLRGDNDSTVQTIKALHSIDVPVYLFTNAPEVWAHTLVKALDLQIETSRCLTSSFGVKMTVDMSLYKRVMNHVTRLDGPHQLVYVEDTFHNLSPIMHLPEWLPVLFEPECCDNLNIGRTRVIKHLEEVVQMI